MSVNADLADNKNETNYSSDRRIILSEEGAFNDEPNTSENVKIYPFKDNSGTVALTNKQSNYNHLELIKKTFYAKI